MNIEPLSLAHKDLLTPLLREVHTVVSEYSFANLYLFRAAHAYEVLRMPDQEIFVRGRAYDGRHYVMPTRDVRLIPQATLRLAAADVDFIYPVAEEWLECFAPQEMDVQFNDADSDYVYAVEKLRTYAGRKLHKKRNLLKQFTEGYAHEAHPLTEDRIPDALQLLEQWQQGMETPQQETDYAACRESLQRYEELVLCGGIFYADGEPAGFVLGEDRPPDTYVLHSAKGLTKFKGIYQYMFNRFAAVLPQQYRYINLEQDLGMESLRISKSSYQPDQLVRKARVRFI